MLNLPLVKYVLENIKAREFMLQTNGTLLHKLEKKELEKFSTILLSIDGDEIMTDYYRGLGTYNKVINNAALVRNRGFNGELIARMTVDEKTDIFQEVKHLMSLEYFDGFHWQLNMQFFEKGRWKDAEKWIREVYNPQINSLIEDWLQKMKHGKVIRIYPFVGVMHSMIHNTPSKLRCGAGWIFQNILTDGTIAPCTDMLELPEYLLGNIYNKSPKYLKDALCVGNPCPECKYYKWCGGRCLVANLTKPWGEEGFNLVCETVKNMIDKLIEVKPEIERLIEKKTISIDDFNYTKYNGCEIIT